MRSRHVRRGGVLAPFLLAATAAAHGQPAAPTPSAVAAVAMPPGYTDDRTCRPCHLALWDSYQDVGMARSFFKPARGRAIEDFSRPTFTHAESGDRITMAWRGDELWFTREQTDAAGQPVLSLSLRVDWILGSGHHARTYLYRSGAELYQLPIAWYSGEGAWGMAPGYDRADHAGVLRQVRRECIVCHNAYPDVPAGADRYLAPPSLPASLPEGTGCQRCHGPGEAHGRLALDPAASAAAIRASIVNPAKLTPSLRDDVCNQCHLQPTVAVPGVRRFGVGDFSYRPGTPLSRHLVQVEGRDTSGEEGGRFEINQHAARLRRSRCSVASPGKLACITCHDPHRRLRPEEKAAHFRRACLTCHAETSCTRHAAPGAAALAYDPADAANDCASCHMPKRRPEDVVHVVVTDHRIQRRPPDGLRAAREERDPTIVGVELLEPETLADEAERSLYRLTALVRLAPKREATDRLAAALATLEAPPREPRLDLALADLQQRRFADAAALLQTLAGEGDPLSAEWLAIAQAAGGDAATAVATLRRGLAGPAERPESRYNLGRLLLARGDADGAARELQRAVDLRPNLASAWLRLGDAHRALGGDEHANVALDAYERALAIQPRLTAAYLALADQLLAAGQPGQARRILLHGTEHAEDPRPVRAKLEGMEPRNDR